MESDPAVVANLVMVVIFWGGPRFRDANAPVLIIYAVAGLWWVRQRTDVFAVGSAPPEAPSPQESPEILPVTMVPGDYTRLLTQQQESNST